MASTVRTTGLVPVESAVDTHICGSCRGEFNDIFKFINHKKLCTGSVVLDSELLTTGSRQNVVTLKAYEGDLEAIKSHVVSHDLYSQENASEPQTESSEPHYTWQSEVYSDVAQQPMPLVESTQADDDDMVPMSNDSFQEIKKPPSHASLGAQSHFGNDYNTNSVPILKFTNTDERSTSTSNYNVNQANHDHTVSFRSSEVLPIDSYDLHVQEQANTDLLGSVETKSLNTIDNSTPCPEDLEVGQISAAMLGKLSKKFSSKGYPTASKTHSTLVDNSVANIPAVGEKDSECYPSLNCTDESGSFITYRNLNTASAPISGKVSLNLRERRERLPGVSDELLPRSSPLCSKSNNYDLNAANYGQSESERNIDSSFPNLVISQREPDATSPPTRTSYKAVFTSPSSAGHRLAPELHGSDLGRIECSLSPQNLSGAKEDLQTLTGEKSLRRDTNTTNYKDISKLIKASHCQTSFVKSLHMTDTETENLSPITEGFISSDGLTSPYLHQPTVKNSLIEDFSNATDLNYVKLKSDDAGKTDRVTNEKLISVELIEPSTTKDVSNMLETSTINSCLPLSSANGWNATEVNQESLLSSGGHLSLPRNDMIINGETVTVAQQPAETKENDAVVMVIRDAANNLVMMCPATEHGEILVTENQIGASSKDSVGLLSQDSNKNPQEMHFLFHSDGQQELTQIQQQEAFYCQESQLQQQQPAEYQYMEKMDQPSHVTGVQEVTEFFRLANSAGDHTCNIAPVQIIAVEDNTVGSVPAAKSHSFYYTPQSSDPNDKGVITLDAKTMKMFQSQSSEVQKETSETRTNKSTVVVRKQHKSPKKGKETWLKMKSFLSPRKARKDGANARMSQDPKGSQSRKLVSATANSSQTFPVVPSDRSFEAVKNSKMSERSFNCKFGSCSYKTNSYKDFQRHYRTHTGEKPFKCNICGRSFNRSDKLKTHMRWHYGQKPFQCKQCDYASVESGSLKKHMRIHNDERPFQCQICSYASRNSSQLVVHLRTHTGDSPFHCNVCSAQFKVNSDLKRHMRIHTGEKPFQCDKCDYRSSNKGNLKTHHRINHSQENEKKCPQCCFASSSTRRLREHIKTHDAAKVIRCSVCQYTCNNATALRSHMMVHNSDKPFSCSVCPYSCKQSGNLKKHMQNVHGLGDRVKIFMEPAAASKRPYCHVGSRKRVKVLEGESLGHRRKRSTNCRKMYVCSKCECSFVRQDSLRCHLKHHSQGTVQQEDSMNKGKCSDDPPGPRAEDSKSSITHTVSKSSPLFVNRQGLDHIVAAASQMYQEQYMTTGGQAGTIISESIHSSGSSTHTSSNSASSHTNLSTGGHLSVGPDDVKDGKRHCARDIQETPKNEVEAQHVCCANPSESHIQSGNVPWEHSCYTLSSAKSRKQSSSSTHRTAGVSTRSSSSSSSNSPLVPIATGGHRLSHQSVHPQFRHRSNSKSIHTESPAIDNSENSKVVRLSQSVINVKKEAKPGLATGSIPESLTLLSGQPQPSDIQLLVRQHPVITPLTQALPVSAFGGCQSQQPTLAMAHEAMELAQAGSADPQTQTLTFQLLPQVATMSQPGTQIALTQVQDLATQLSLQAATSLAPTQGSAPIQISFPTGGHLIPQASTLMTQPQTGSQLIPQAPTLMAQPQIVFQLTGTNQLNQPGQEVISIATDQTSSGSLGNQASHLVLGPCSSYGHQPQTQMVTIPVDMASVKCVQQRDMPGDGAETTESFQASSSF